jgi:hypothetical protein
LARFGGQERRVGDFPRNQLLQFLAHFDDYGTRAALRQPL